MEERINVTAKRKKSLKGLATRLGGLGFTSIDLSKDDLIIEKSMGESSDGKADLDYRIVFGRNNIELVYFIPEKANKKERVMKIFPIFINALLLADEYYDIKAASLFDHVNNIMQAMGKMLNKDLIDLSSELEELKVKHADLSKKYNELVTSSEENARILLECERRRDELYTRVQNLERLSDNALKEELYKWIKVHGGSLNLEEFCKSYQLPIKRAEEGIDMLIKEGYIKSRAD